MTFTEKSSPFLRLPLLLRECFNLVSITVEKRGELWALSSLELSALAVTGLLVSVFFTQE